MVDFSSARLRCLYTEEVSIGSMGRMAVTRASHVEYDSDVQAWFVWTPDWELLDQPETGFASRREALAFEERWANSNLLSM